MTDRMDLDRRGLLKGTAGALALAMGGGTPFLGTRRAYAAASGLASEQLRTIGLSVTVQDRILADYKKESGVGSTSGTAATFPDAQTKILSGSKDYDCWEIIAERLPAVVQTNNVDAVPVAEVKNWANIRDTFTKANPKWDKSAQIVGQIWADDAQSKLWMVPAVYNYDSIGYNPDALSAEEANTWTAIFDPKYKGRSGLNTDPLIAFGQALLAMTSLKLLDAKNPGNPTKEEVEEGAKFLIAKKKDGSRPLWPSRRRARRAGTRCQRRATAHGPSDPR
jgi:putative spermidine/putrescine transport system substrate-binding protein